MKNSRPNRFVWRWKGGASALCVILPLSGCNADLGSETVSQSQEATICGPTFDWQDIEFYNGSDATFNQAFVARYQGAFGMRCSGTLISTDLFLTVKHSGCAPSVGSNIGFNCQLDGSLPYPPMGTQDQVDAANAAAAARCDDFTVAEIVFESSNPDISVSRLTGNPGLTYGWVNPSVRAPHVGEQVAVFQHPQQNAGPKRRKVVTFGPVVSSNTVNLWYQADTYGGSSGSGVLDAFGMLVAVHRASGCSESGGSNAGTNMPYIVANVPPVRAIAASIWMATTL